ncbi:MAG: EndoU domain-containing protein, partial [Achromobacter sp.]
SSSTTQSGISGGTIVIRDEAGQLALTGKTAAETIASLNRDTSDTLNALKPIFDKEKIEAGFEIASEASKQMGQFLTNRAKETLDAKERSEDKSLSYAERAKAAQEYADLESKWGAQGTYSQWGTVILGAASGNVMGGTGQFIQAATVNYLQTLGAAQIKELSGVLGGEGSVGHAALHAVLGCAGAAAQGASCGAGGAGALSGVVLSKLLDSVDDVNRKKLTPEEEQARVNLISSIVAGIAASIDPTAAVPAEVAARIEVENNSRYMNLDKVARMKAEVTAKAIATCANDNSCLQAEFDRADKMAAAYDVALMLRHYPQLSKEKADTLAQAVLDLAPGVSNASALYELLTGKTATGDEANRYFAAIGLVPVLGGIIKKGGQAVHVFAEADKAIDAAKVGGKAPPADVTWHPKEYVDILPPDSKKHILYGDGPGSGGHMWPGQPGKTVFPENWSAEKIIHEIGDVATSPNTQWYAQSGTGGLYTKAGDPARWVAWDVRDGVRMRVVYEPASGKVITAFPDNNPVPALKPIKP